MDKNRTQRQRLDYLVERFMEDSHERFQTNSLDRYTEEQEQRVLRSLMNVRMPRKMDSQVLEVQDEYLSQLAKEKGVVSWEDIPTVGEQFGSGASHSEKIAIWQGDITRLEVDAIVNAANSQMLGCFIPMHACIDNCIHSFAGIQLRMECDQKMKRLRERYGSGYEQPTSVPMLTKGYNLPAKHVIHVVGPIVHSVLTEELEAQLADCYRNVLDMCAANQIRSVAFCCISTGVFHFPNERAAKIAVQTVGEWLDEKETLMDKVIFNVFKDEDRGYYERLF